MANKRMFSLTVCDSDKFLEMSQSAQLLYFHLGLHGDDDGFIGSPKKITRACGCDASDIKELIDNGFIFQFESGVVAVVDWNVNNYLQNDRYHRTIYQTEKAMLTLDSSKRYRWIQNVSNSETEHSVTQPSIAKPQQSIARTQGNRGLQGGEPQNSGFVPPTLDEVKEFANGNGLSLDPVRFFNYYQQRGWMNGRDRVQNWQGVYIARDRQFRAGLLPGGGGVEDEQTL